MKKLRRFWKANSKSIFWIALGLAVMAGLLLYKLGGLTGGLSAGEAAVATAPVGWHGIWQSPLELPLKLIRSLVFGLSADHGQLLTRLPNALFGGLAMLSFGWLIWLWHGSRTAIFTTLLFATGAWTLHVSRLASADVLYLWAAPTLLVIQALLHRHSDKPLIWYGSLLAWGFMLYIPGLVWLVLVHIFLKRNLLRRNWRKSYLFVLVLLPLLIVDLTRSGELLKWLGLPTDLAPPITLLKQLLLVPVHLFVHGPQQPELWLGRAPLLEIFTLLAFGLGAYFYLQNWRASRTRLIGSMFIIGALLIGLGGPVSLSLLVPLVYACAAAGIAYLLHEWLKVFPFNPLARGLGIGLISVVIGLSCLYNLRAYFIAWPHNSSTRAVFSHYRP